MAGRFEEVEEVEDFAENSLKLSHSVCLYHHEFSSLPPFSRSFPSISLILSPEITNDAQHRTCYSRKSISTEAQCSVISPQVTKDDRNSG
jgi:hypothetical protein